MKQKLLSKLVENVTVDYGFCKFCGKECIVAVKGHENLELARKLCNGYKIDIPTLDKDLKPIEKFKYVECFTCARTIDDAKETKEKPKTIRRYMKQVKPVYQCNICYNTQAFSSKQLLEMHLYESHDSYYIKRAIRK
jgi:hypothetical protein